MENQSFSEIHKAGLQSDSRPFKLLNGNVFFNGSCEECRAFCAAICCRGYTYIALTEEEANSGLYAYREASDTCECETCRKMRESAVRYAIAEVPDGSCIYLDGNRNCSIYEKRPEACRKYSCVNVAFALVPPS